MTTRALMIRDGTPLEDHTKEFGLWVKREDLSCLPPGPAFSKTRGVYAHIANRPESVIGVLDTYHSQAGHAVARACQLLGKRCVNFYPEFKHEPGPRLPQARAAELGAQCVPLPAGRSAILYHQAKKVLLADFADEDCHKPYLMPNALKLQESVTETTDEVRRLPEDFHPDLVLIPSSSATIAAGVIRGFLWRCHDTYISLPRFIIHLGYSRSEAAVRDYIATAVDLPLAFHKCKVDIVDEGYGYRDRARKGPTPPWPCNEYYDLKAFRWWMSQRLITNALFWNVG